MSAGVSVAVAVAVAVADLEMLSEMDRERPRASPKEEEVGEVAVVEGGEVLLVVWLL